MNDYNNNKVNNPRIMIAAPKSGSGKTMLTIGLLRLLSNMGINVGSYKCGPDYIDPMFHRKVLKVPCGNLDTCFVSDDAIRTIVMDDNYGMTVMEGVMGIYDGIGGIDIKGSCYDIASVTNTPIILVVDAKGCGATVASYIKGILSDDYNHLIKGIILNRVSENFYDRLKAVVSKALESYSDTRLIGYIPDMKGTTISSRHLGLHMPDEINKLDETIDKVANAISEHCDIEAIIGIANSAAQMPAIDKEESTYVRQYSNISIAVAMDEAFCFYYRENLSLFEKLGAKLIYFSPLHDSKVPDDVQLIILGGGYPENHLDRLASNTSMLSSIYEHVQKGTYILAECGGFMYLHEYIEANDGSLIRMVGAIEGTCRNTGHLVRFGYVQLEHSNIPSLNGMKGHEFHYYDSTNNGEAVHINKLGDDRQWKGMHVKGTMLCGFPHLYYQSKPEFIYDLLEKIECRK